MKQTNQYPVVVTGKASSINSVNALDRYLRGQDKALSVVAVPSEDQEEKRALIRYHRQIMDDRGRYEARGKGLLCAQAARRLAIDLWRLSTGQTTPEKLGLIMHCSAQKQ